MLRGAYFKHYNHGNIAYTTEKKVEHKDKNKNEDSARGLSYRDVM